MSDILRQFRQLIKKEQKLVALGRRIIRDAMDENRSLWIQLHEKGCRLDPLDFDSKCTCRLGDFMEHDRPC